MALNIEFHNQRKRVRVEAGMNMFQVMESARDLFGLDASAQYELTHRARPVDLSIPFRLTGISNNAALELREVAAGQGGEGVQQVRVAVQSLEGKRVQEVFGSDATLAHIVTSFQQLPGSQEFSLTYMQREIAFDAFETTTLKDLGIISGSAMFRMQRQAGAPHPVATPPTTTITTTPSTVQPPRSVTFAQEPAAPVYTSSLGATEEEEKHWTPPPAAPAQQPAAPSPSTPVAALAPVTVDDDDVEMAVAEPPIAHLAVKLSSYDALQRLRDSCFDSVSRTAIITLMKIITNILSYPENEKMRSIRVTNSAFHRNVGQHKGGIDFLESVGFVLDAETETLVLRDVEQSKTLVEKSLKLLNVEADDLQIEHSQRPQVVVPVQPDAAFDAFKPVITRLQAQPRGPSATEVLVDKLKVKQEELLQRIEKPPRNTTILYVGQQHSSSGTSTTQRDVDMTSRDDGPSDASLVMASMKARRDEMEKAKNFRTQAMRELDELKRKKVFQQALIRVQFPDRVILQAAFHPTETVADVIAHIQESFGGQVANDTAFYLYVSPPLQKLSPEKSLSELGLVPAAHTYLSWTTPPQPKDKDESHTELAGWYLQQDLLTPDTSDSKNGSENEGASYPNSVSLDEDAAAKAALAAKKAAAEAALKRAAGGESKPKSAKKPSWLKL